MPVPPFADIKTQSLDITYTESQPVYTNSYTKTANYENTFKIYNLTPSYSYTTYCYTENLNNIVSTSHQQLNFTVVNPQTTATFTLQINTPFVSKVLRDEYVKRLSTIMGITSNRTTEKVSCIGESPVGTEPSTTYITYYVSPDPTISDNDLSPISLVRNLNTKRDEIEKFVPT